MERRALVSHPPSWWFALPSAARPTDLGARDLLVSGHLSRTSPSDTRTSGGDSWVGLSQFNPSPFVLFFPTG